MLSDQATGAVLGQALVCPETRYASLRLNAADRLERCVATPAHWRKVAGEIASGLASEPLHRASAIAGLLGQENWQTPIVVQYAWSQNLEVTKAFPAARLDDLLSAVRPYGRR